MRLLKLKGTHVHVASGWPAAAHAGEWARRRRQRRAATDHLPRECCAGWGGGGGARPRDVAEAAAGAMNLPPIRPQHHHAVVDHSGKESRRCATVPLRSRGGPRRNPRRLRTAAASDSPESAPARSDDADASWARLLARPKHTLGAARAPPVVLWPGTPTNKSKRDERAVGDDVEKICLDPSWERPDSFDSEEDRRDGRARNQYKSPSKLSHLGERVRRFRPEWRPVPLAELYRKQHEKEQNLRRLQLEPIETNQATAEHRRQRQKHNGTHRHRKKHKLRPADSAQLSGGAAAQRSPSVLS